MQFALGSSDENTIVGLTQHQVSLAFPPNDRPIAGLYRVTLHRVLTAPAAQPDAAADGWTK